MPNYREDFRSRLPKPSYDELTYAADRERLYPGTNGQFTDSQTEAHKQYKDLQLENQRASNAYFNGRDNAINYVRGMPLEEGGYYVKTSASMTPKDHYGLKGKAQSLVGAEVA